MLVVNIKGVLGSFQIDVDIHTKEAVIALYGDSGSGKTSILRAIAGLWQPDEGVITIDDRVIYHGETGVNVPSPKRRLGVVFQAPLLFPHMSVEKNLRYGQGEKTTGLGRVVCMLDLGNLLNRMPRNLSGGEAQRVALGRALLADPQMLLLDEPLTGLDESRRQNVLPYLELLRDEVKIPMVYVSHNREEILRLADTVFVVAKGRVQKNISLKEFEDLTQLPPVRRRDKS